MLIDERMQNLAKLLDVASLRARVHSANIANQNTPGYRAKAVAFDEAFRAAVERDPETARGVEPTIYEPQATTVGNDGNDVAVDHEVAELAKNQTLYQAYVSMLRGKNTLYRTAVRGAR